MDAKIKAVLEADPNTIFSNDYSDITNNVFQVNRFDDKNRKAEAILKELNSKGDSDNARYNMGIYKDRKMNYSVAPATIGYYQRISGNLWMTDILGSEVNPWDILPGQWIFYSDFLIGKHLPINALGLHTDPRAGYIESVKFSAPNKVSVNGEKLGELDQMMAKFSVRGVGA